MFDNRNQQQQQPSLFGAPLQQQGPAAYGAPQQSQQQPQQQQQQQQQQQVFPPQYQGVDPYAQRSPPKAGASLNIQQQSFPVGQVSPLPGQHVFEHKVITTSVQQQQHFNTDIKTGKRSFCVDWCIYFIPILFLIAILVFMSFILIQKSRDFDQQPIDNVLGSLAKNQGFTPIADLVTLLPAPSSTRMAKHFQHNAPLQCPPGFALTNFGQWPGVNSGCICNGEVKQGNFCWANGCTSIEASDAKPFQVWDGEKLCMKLTSTWVKLSGTGCSDTYKKCGNVCVPQADVCPLSDLTKLDVDPTSDSVDSPDDLAALQVVKIGDNWYKKSYGGVPLVQLQVIPGNGVQAKNTAPCLNDLTTTSFESQLSYPLLKKPAKGCDQYGDFANEVLRIDTQKARGIEAENGISLNGIQGYKTYLVDSDSYTLVGVRRVLINPSSECSQISPADVNQLVEDSNDVYNYRVWFSRIIFWTCIISLVLIVFLYLIRNRTFQSFDVNHFRQPKILLLLAVIVAFLCIVFGALYWYNLGNDNGLVGLDNKFNGYLTNDCFSSKGIRTSIDSLHQFAQAQYNNLTFWILLAFWVSIIFLVLLLILIIIQKGTHGDLLSNPWWQKSSYEQF